MSVSKPLSPQPGLQTVTPVQAANLLATAAVNRTLKKQNVDYLRRQIELGRWKPTAGTLGVNEEGQLVEGQHRCQAISEAGVPVEIEIRLIRQSDVLAVDTGIVRSAADLFAIRNIANPSNAAACIRMVTSVRASAGKPAINLRYGNVLSNEELWEILRADPAYIAAAEVGRQLKEHTPFMTASFLAALYYMFAQAAGEEKARAFLDAVALDTETSTNALTYGLRRWLLRAEAQRRKPSKYHAVMLFISSWNRWLKGKEGRVGVPRTVQVIQGPRVAPPGVTLHQPNEDDE